MVKKTTNFNYDEDDDELVIDKKSKRKQAKANRQQQKQQRAPEEEGGDTMSRVALLCQEGQWREAVLLCRKALEIAIAENKEDLKMTLEMALPKLEYSLRRQQAAALISSTKVMLQKEYRLDVGE
ncbi:MAG: hypothetical protein J6X55_01020 [Victivallales bacterium]|nr:hypothetical protein [Victivallales bacterium]